MNNQLLQKDVLIKRIQTIADAVMQGLESRAMEIFTLHAEDSGPDFNALKSILTEQEIVNLRKCAVESLRRNSSKLANGLTNEIDKESYRRDLIDRPAAFFGISAEEIAGEETIRAKNIVPRKKELGSKNLSELKSLLANGTTGESPVRSYRGLIQILKVEERAFLKKRAETSDVEQLLPLIAKIDGTLKAMAGLQLPENEAISRLTVKHRLEAPLAEMKELAFHDLGQKSLSLGSLKRTAAIYSLGRQLAMTAAIFGEEDARYKDAKEKILSNPHLLKSLHRQIDQARITSDYAEDIAVANSILKTLHPDISTEDTNLGVVHAMGKKIAELARKHSLH